MTGNTATNSRDRQTTADEIQEIFFDITDSHDPDRVKAHLYKQNKKRNTYYFIEHWPSSPPDPSRLAAIKLFSQLIINGRSPKELEEIHGAGNYRLSITLRGKKPTDRKTVHHYFLIGKKE